jgi:hypothetical protein
MKMPYTRIPFTVDLYRMSYLGEWARLYEPWPTARRIHVDDCGRITAVVGPNAWVQNWKSLPNVALRQNRIDASEPYRPQWVNTEKS